MATVVRAEAKITAQNALRPGLNSAISDLRRFRQQADQLAKHRALEEQLGRIGNAMKAAIGGFVAYQGVEQLRRAVTDFAKFDREMTRIGITGDNASPEDIAKGVERLRALAMETASPIKDLKEGMAALTSAGLNFQESLAMMPAVARTAQASGSKTEDIANSSLAIIRHLKVETKDLQKAQDMITRGGELGQFELKDMARYLPSMAPAAKALGIEGTKGLAQMVAMLQIIREGTGTAEEAASSANNIFAKMESEETANKFKKMGVDLRKEMEKARKAGENTLDAFVRITEKALKGDMSKLPQLFQDMEFARGMRALLAGYGKLPDLIDKINNSQGAVTNNLKRITGDTQATLDRFGESADRARQAVGGLVADLTAPGLDNAAGSLQSIAETLERMRAAAKDGGIVGAITAGAKDFKDAVDRDLAKRREELQREQDDQTLANMPERVAQASAHAGRHVRVNQEAIRKLEAMPPSAERDKKLATLRNNLAMWQKSAGPTPDELAAFSRQLGREKGAPKVTGEVDPEMVNQLRSDFLEMQRARARMGQTGPLAGLPVPPQRITKPSTFGDVPVQGFDEAVTKAGEVKSSLEQAAAAAKTPGPALAASVGAGVDQAISHIDRLEQRMRNIRMPNMSMMTGFPTGKTMGEVD